MKSGRTTYVWLSPLGLANHDTALKTTMNSKPITVSSVISSDPIAYSPISKLQPFAIVMCVCCPGLERNETAQHVSAG